MRGRKANLAPWGRLEATLVPRVGADGANREVEAVVAASLAARTAASSFRRWIFASYRC